MVTASRGRCKPDTDGRMNNTHEQRGERKRVAETQERSVKAQGFVRTHKSDCIAIN